MNSGTPETPGIAACLLLALAIIMNESVASPPPADADIEQRVTGPLEQMTLAEKIGQMAQVNAGDLLFVIKPA